MNDYKIEVKPEESNLGTLYRVYIESDELEHDYKSKPYTTEELAKNVANNVSGCLEARAGLINFSIFKQVEK